MLLKLFVSAVSVWGEYSVCCYESLPGFAFNDITFSILKLALVGVLYLGSLQTQHIRHSSHLKDRG